MDTLTPDQIADEIWDSKYRLKELDGTPIDKSIEDTWRRVATALAAAEEPAARKHWFQKFMAILRGGLFSTAGRIIAGAGTDRNVTLSNCFTMGTIPDSMEGIFSHLKEAALTMQAGGGIGYDFSTLRPKGAPVVGVAADASGPLTFMDVWDAMCRTVMSAGSRRGAMMATMRCDHPDIVDFVTAKKDPKRLRMFNLSVLVTDEFMAAVAADLPWRLHFENRRGETLVERFMPARELWDLIMRSTYDAAEPGVIFIDRVNDDHNLGYLELIATTNPCGEKPMGPYASCLLGSIILVNFIRRAFSNAASVDFTALRHAVKVAIRMMDNVIDVGKFPLPAQKEKAENDRQLGLGITGLADALAMMGIAYGSDEAVVFTEQVMQAITEAAYDASIEIAQEKGPFPTFDADEFLKPTRFAGRMLDAERQAKIRRHGIRNGLLISIAPTGTISMFAGNISSGIEPIFAYSYTRNILQPDGSKRKVKVEDFAVAAYRQQWMVDNRIDDPADWHEDNLPNYFVTAQTLPPEAHVKMQAAAQKWVDSSISKTINLPEDISFEDFKGVYQMAYDMGCKGCTTYRPNAITGSVIQVEPKPAEKAPEPAVQAVEAPVAFEAPAAPQSPPVAALRQRAEALAGQTYKLKWPGSADAIYITINDVDGRPFEVFINSKNMEHYAWTVALTRMISAIFRRGGEIDFVAEELKAVFDPRGGGYLGGKYVPSILAAIGDVIERHIRNAAPVPAAPSKLAAAVQVAMQEALVSASTPILPTTMPIRPPGPACPSCGSYNMKVEAGCKQCLDCGHSACN